MIGFAHDAAKFWYYCLMTASTLLMMTSFGLLFLVSATCMVELVQMLSGAINFLFNQFNGEAQNMVQLASGSVASLCPCCEACLCCE
jgi:hypothetical protein